MSVPSGARARAIGATGTAWFFLQGCDNDMSPQFGSEISVEVELGRSGRLVCSTAPGLHIASGNITRLAMQNVPGANRGFVMDLALLLPVAASVWQAFACSAETTSLT